MMIHPSIRLSDIAVHQIRSVTAKDEPARHFARALADLAQALPTAAAFGDKGARLVAAATTPDFHPGKPVPVGLVADVEHAVLPHAIGSDIGCGMRMLVLDGIGADDIADPTLEKHARHVFFQGGRDIALNGRHRQAILREGLPGLLEGLAARREGLLAGLDLASAWADLDRQCDSGAFAAGLDPDFADYARPDDTFRRDAILGTIGGGNHFVEIGVVETIADGTFAHAAGLSANSVVCVIHSGSLDFGQRVATGIGDKLRTRARPGEDSRILSREADADLYRRYLTGHANAVNAAFANRFFLGLAMVEAVQRTVKRPVGHRLIYDAPHNTVWEQGTSVRHRKGACPARGPGFAPGSPYHWLGEPVILPGSMGDGTWLLSGRGATATLESSAHGAGRRLSRQEARACASIDGTLRVVGPLDPQDPAIAGRPDIRAEIAGRLKEEAPDAYKPIDSVVEPMEAAGMVARVAKIHPVMTVKG